MPHVLTTPGEMCRTPHTKFVAPPVTKEELPWADLIQLDLGEFYKGPEARTKLAHALLESAHLTGFLYIINHGISPATVVYHVDIANTILGMTEADKVPYYATKERAQAGRFTGFKPAQLGAAS